MGYPTPDQWRAHAAHAKAMAEEYRSEGNIEQADRREATAEFYLDKAHEEEWRQTRKINKALEGIAA